MKRNEWGFYSEFDDGKVVIHTRFPWHQFNEKWQKGLLLYARSAFEDPRVECVHIDHINVNNETFEPRIDLRKL